MLDLLSEAAIVSWLVLAPEFLVYYLISLS